MIRFTVGDIVFIKENAPHGGQRAFVYEVYHDFDEEGECGVSLITESGEDTGGWSRDEQRIFLEPMGHSGMDYKFINVIRLAEDWRNGVFKEAFK